MFVKQAKMTIHPDYRIGEISPRLFGAFLEPIGSMVNGSMYNPKHPAADEQGLRRDFYEALREAERRRNDRIRKIEMELSNALSTAFLGVKLAVDIVDAETRDIIAPAGKRITKTAINKLTRARNRFQIEEGEESAKVEAVIDQQKQAYAARGARKIGYSEVKLPAKDENGDWLVRNVETSLGDMCADAFRIALDTDVAMIGGGSIRADLPAGDVTYDSIFNVFPFNNRTCTATLTGQQILDVLEFGVASYPAAFGGFLQVSGMTYAFDPSVESPVVYDINKAFVRIDPGLRRIRDVQVLDKKTGKYEPIDPARSYTVGGTDYFLMNCGDGYEMLKGVGHETGSVDVDMLEHFIIEHLKGDIRASEYGQSAGRIIRR